jgi:hypothetical protein
MSTICATSSLTSGSSTTVESVSADISDDVFAPLLHAQKSTAATNSKINDIFLIVVSISLAPLLQNRSIGF